MDGLVDDVTEALARSGSTGQRRDGPRVPPDGRAAGSDAGPDETLTAAVVRGQATALATLYDRYATAVFSLAARITQDQGLAAEITQAAFVHLWRHAATVTPGRKSVASWLLATTRQLAIEQVRRQRQRPATTATDERRLDEWPDSDAEVAEPAWLRERRARAWQALARLPAGQRQVIELAYFGGLTRAEVAAQLGVPLGTATTWLRLGLHTLQELDTCE